MIKALLIAAFLAGWPGGAGKNGDQFPMPSGGGTPTAPSREIQYTEPNDFWYVARYRPNVTTELSDGTEFIRNTVPYPNWYMMDDYMNLRRAWEVTTGSDDVVIAMIDQEVQWWHYDLVDNIWTNPGETADNGIDDDGNGLIDDVRGWNFLGWNGDPSHRISNGDDTDAGNSQHGTQMAGILAAQGNNESWTASSLVPDTTSQRQGSTGVAWDVSLIPIKAFPSGAAHLVDDPAFAGLGLVSAAEYVADLATNRGIDISACSMSYTGLTSYVVSRLIDANVLPLTGAANTGGTMGWATHPGVGADGDSLLISAAINQDKKRSPYSAYGTRVDLSGWGGGSSSDPGAPYYQFWWSPGGCPCGWRNIVPGWSNYPFFWTLGWAPVGLTGSPLEWIGNEVSEAATGHVTGYTRPGILPSAGLTSGTVPMTAGIATLVETSCWNVANWSTLRSLILRSCKDKATIESNSTCGTGDCSGLLGAGVLDAYRAVTLWGKVDISLLPATITEDLYVAGDVLLSGSGFITLSNMTVWVAPDDLYEDDIEPTGDAPSTWLFDRATEITSEPANRLTPNGTCIYVGTGVGIVISGTVTFRSWAASPGSADWEGIHTVGGSVFGTPTVLNSAN